MLLVGQQIEPKSQLELISYSSPALPHLAWLCCLLNSTTIGCFKNGSFLGLDTTNAGGTFTFGSALNDTFAGPNSLGLVKLGSGTLAEPSTYAILAALAAGSVARVVRRRRRSS